MDRDRGDAKVAACPRDAYRRRIPRRADWSKPSEVKADIGTASILKDGRVVFNIAGNKYRIR
jgi:mRNA interferase HigB